MNTLKGGGSLGVTQELRSDNGLYVLTMQGDGNLVLYGPDGRARFATATFGGDDSVAVLQTDGNLVVYDGGRAIWATGTHRPVRAPVDSFAAVLQDDGNFVLYDAGERDPDGRPVWSSQRGRLR